MKLFAVFWFSHLILVDIILCERNSEFNLRSDCFFTDENNPNCGFPSNEIKEKSPKLGKHNLDSSLFDLLRAKQKVLMTKSRQSELFEPDINDTNLNSPKNEQQISLTAEEPRFVIIRKEHDFPLKLDSRNFWEFIPPRGRKGHFDLNDDMFMPNRGKKDKMEWRDKKSKQNQIAFELNDDFYPVRGRRLSDIVGNSQQAAYDEDLFYPNRGKRSNIKIKRAIAVKLHET